MGRGRLGAKRSQWQRKQPSARLVPGVHFLETHTAPATRRMIAAGTKRVP